MNLQQVCCDNPACVDKYQGAKGNIVCHVQKRQQGKCNRCGQTFAYPPQHMPPLRLVQVQGAEMCRKTPGQVPWLTMAIAGGSRLWLGAARQIGTVQSPIYS